MVADIDQAAAEAVTAEIEQAGGAALRIDVSLEDDLRSMADEARRHFGGVDILHKSVAYTSMSATRPSPTWRWATGTT